MSETLIGFDPSVAFLLLLDHKREEFVDLAGTESRSGVPLAHPSLGDKTPSIRNMGHVAALV